MDFLRLENDSETLKSIGYVEFYGEEYGLRKTFSTSNALIQLSKRYKETEKAEYLDYADFLERMRKKSIPLILAFFASFFLSSIVFESAIH